jgi:hypothetical protein
MNHRKVRFRHAQSPDNQDTVEKDSDDEEGNGGSEKKGATIVRSSFTLSFLCLLLELTPCAEKFDSYTHNPDPSS